MVGLSDRRPRYGEPAAAAGRQRVRRRRQRRRERRSRGNEAGNAVADADAAAPRRQRSRSGADGNAAAAAATATGASGTEPFWSLAIGGGQMVYDSADGPDVTVPTPPQQPTRAGYRYVTPEMTVAVNTFQRCEAANGAKYHDTRAGDDRRRDGRPAAAAR